MSARRRRERGQSVVEYAALVPVFLLLLLGILEFGFIFDESMTLNYATREGARSGSAFAHGNTTSMTCTSSVDVDKNIVAAVERVLDAPGSRIDKSKVSKITIYRASGTGTDSGTHNTWVYSVGNGPSVDGTNLDFSPNASQSNWNACARKNTWTTTAPDSLGVSIEYTYQFVTPLANILAFFGGGSSGSLPISDRTVMALNPTNN